MLILICLKLNEILNTGHQGNLIENRTIIPLTGDKFVLEPKFLTKITINKITLVFDESILIENQQHIFSFYDQILPAINVI